MDNWDKRFLDTAALVKEWSKDPSTKIGAVIVKDKRIISTGFNGFPPGISDDSRLHDRSSKYRLVVHAELNAILNAAKNGVPLDGATIYVDGLHVCTECAKAAVAAGIKRVVSRQDIDIERWAQSLSDASDLLVEAGVDYETA